MKVPQSFHILTPVSCVINILTFQTSQIVIVPGTLLLTEVPILFRYPYFFTCYFCSRITSRIVFYISLSCLLRHLLAVTVSQTFLLFSDLENFEEFWILCRMSLSLDLFVFSFMIRMGYDVLGENITEGKGHFHHFMSRVHALNMT